MCMRAFLCFSVLIPCGSRPFPSGLGRADRHLAGTQGRDAEKTAGQGLLFRGAGKGEVALPRLLRGHPHHVQADFLGDLY